MGNTKDSLNDKAAFECCIDFMVRMYEKYAPLYEPVTIEMVREIFGATQCKCA
ncbi:MAG: hypothetical protein HUJ72_09945 [Blautia sp.]|nr:hypothetical protein [Blautia sp.]